ncbi:MAG TPA: heme-binding domain-containing protein [Pyrinomonadaceae bacterium]|nr:heme-binding domain-containing protein [Pyrinomonadaceae bacterium]
MKARLLKLIKWVLIVVACLFVIAQFKRPAKTNPAFDQSMALEAHTQLDPKVAAIFDRSCNDCHSNKTRWPWYANVAPVSWFVIDHVEEGREHMNLSEWGKYSSDERKALLGDFCELVTENAMPLSSYTPLHPGSKLSDEDKKVICEWAAAERARTR